MKKKLSCSGFFRGVQWADGVSIDQLSHKLLGPGHIWASLERRWEELVGGTWHSLAQGCVPSSHPRSGLPHSRPFINAYEEMNEIWFCHFGNRGGRSFHFLCWLTRVVKVLRWILRETKCYIYGKAASRGWSSFQAHSGRKLRVCQHFHYENRFAVS